MEKYCVKHILFLKFSVYDLQGKSIFAPFMGLGLCEFVAFNLQIINSVTFVVGLPIPVLVNPRYAIIANNRVSWIAEQLQGGGTELGKGPTDGGVWH